MVISTWKYILFLLPTYLIGLSILSFVIWFQIRTINTIIFASLGCLLSSIWSFAGEFTFTLIYIFYLLVINKKYVIPVFMIFMEINLLIKNIQFCSLDINDNYTAIAAIITTLFIDFLIFIVFIIFYYKKREFFNEIHNILLLNNKLCNCLNLYVGTNCGFLYIFEFCIETHQSNIPKEIDLMLLMTIVFTTIGTFFILFVMMLEYKEHLNLIWTKKSQDAEAKYYKNLNQQQINTNNLIHDYKNLLLTLQISSNEINRHNSSNTIDIIHETKSFLDKCEISNDSISKIPNIPLKSLIYLKWTEASNQKVEFLIQVSDEVTERTFNINMDVIRILGILIDNALEETKKINNNIFELIIDYDNYSIDFTVINKVNSNFDLNKLDCPGFTTKGKGHGHGMKIIDELINKNNGWSIRKKLINDRLEITLFIKIKN